MKPGKRRVRIKTVTPPDVKWDEEPSLEIEFALTTSGQGADDNPNITGTVTYLVPQDKITPFSACTSR